VNLVCHWAGETPSSKWGMVLLGSMCISFLTLIPFVGARVEIALDFLFSLFIHELLHGYGYFRAKIPFYIVFIGFLGAAAVTADTNYNKMKHWDKSIMLLLGPIGSLLVAIFWWIFSLIDPANSSTYMMLAGFNLTLVLFNMIALGGLDGGRIYLSMMASLREDREKYVAITMVVVSIIVLVHAFLQSFRFELIIFFLLLMVIGFVKTIGKDNPTDYLREPAMTTGKVLIVMMMYLGLFTVSAIIYPLFPDWSPLVVVHPFIGAHLPEILMFLSIVGLWVMATDLSHWGLSHKKYKPATELVAVFLLLGVPLVLAVNVFEGGASTAAILLVVASSGLVGNFSMRALIKWKKIHDEIMAKRPVEPELDIFEVVGDTA
jgi:Zn-dependent protease